MEVEILGECDNISLTVMINRIENSDGNTINPIGHESPLSTIDIAEGQRFIGDQFLQFYENHGYQSLSSAGLLPQDDRSVLFTGATITPLKKFLVEGLSSPGYCLVQKCFRSKRLDEMTDLNKIPDWTHYFTMCGILSAPGRLGEVSSEAYAFLIEDLKIDKNNLLILAVSEDRDLSKYWRDKGIKVEEDSNSRESYRWKYGMPGIYGRGINLLLRHGDGYPYRELGNIISVENAEEEVKAYEFGFGLESLLSTLHGFKKPIETSLVSSVIPYKEGLQEKLIDVLMATVVIFHHGVELGRGKERHVLKKLVKGLSFLRRKMNVSIEQIADWSDKFETAEFCDNNSRDKVITGVLTYEQQLLKFIDYAKNQVHAHKLRNDVGEKLLVKLRREGGNMGILPVEIDEVITAVLS